MVGIDCSRFKVRGWYLLTKKMNNMRVVSCFIWGKMRTAAWEAASHIALRDCSKAAVGKIQYIRFW